ncbi:MAG: L-threonylcarbamoyladenylate synthase [Lysobacterales bacterium]
MALLNARDAAGFVSQGGVIAYPTEGVFGIGCDPFNDAAVDAVLELKGRPADKGMIVIASNISQIDPWVAWAQIDRGSILASWPGPVTWILPATDQAPPLVTSNNAIAVRIPSHPPMRELLDACETPLVSTSANRSSEAPASTHEQVNDYFAYSVPIVDGPLGGRQQPTEIRDARSGQVVRKG